MNFTKQQVSHPNWANSENIIMKQVSSDWLEMDNKIHKYEQLTNLVKQIIDLEFSMRNDIEENSHEFYRLKDLIENQLKEIENDK